MFLPLSSIFGFCRDVKIVFRGVKHTIILDRAEPDDYGHRAAGVANGEFEIKRLSLWMSKVIPSITKQLELTSTLESFSRIMYFVQDKVYYEQMPVTTTHSWRITMVPDDQLPRYIFFILDQDVEQIHKNKIKFCLVILT